MIRAVIFDMDGLIIESESLQSKAYEQIVREYRKQPQYEENGLIHTVGIRGDEAWKVLLAKHNITADIEKLRERKREIYVNLLKEHLVPMEGLLPLLTLLENNHIPRALATGTNKKIATFILEGLGILEHFSVLVTGDMVIKGKPDPECFIVCAKQLKVDPYDCLVLEDAEAGILAAKKIGMQVIAVPTIYTRKHDFSQADFVVKSLTNIDKQLIDSL
jgi:HAD superfamily hydrolase (TIGR01509 family)